MNQSVLPSLLERSDLLAIFGQMDQFLAGKNSHHTFTIIGSAVLITAGMPGRATGDVDVWETEEADRRLLQDMAKSCGIAFSEGSTDQSPRLSWVGNEFIGLPDQIHWNDDVVSFWAGTHLTLVRPPTGVLLGSKLVAFRAKDVADINWLVDNDPKWKEGLDKYTPLFSPEHQREIARNLVFVDYHIEARGAALDSPNRAHMVLPSRRTP